MKDKFNRMLSALVLMTMALGLVVAPTATVSADPSGPLIAEEIVDAEILPANAKAGAHFVFIFQTTTPVPLTGEFFVHFPTAYQDGQIAGLAGHPEQTQVTWLVPPTLPYPPCYTYTTIYSPTAGNDYFPIPDPDINPANPEDKVVNWGACTGWTGLPDAVNTRATQSWIPEGQVRLSLDPFTHGKTTNNVPTGSWIRIDFWGPSNQNPGESSASIENPDTPGDYWFCVATDEEHVGDPTTDPPTMDIDGWQCTLETIKPPLPVRLYRKRQVPLANSDYTELEYVAGFEKIQPALDAADDVWLITGDYSDESTWNLFDGCPNLSEMCDPYTDDPGDPECVFVNGLAAAKAVPVGALIEVDADANADDVADVYTETLIMDTPGVILASKPTTNVLRAIIKAPAGTVGGTPVVDINAGGITLGKVEIDTGEDELYVLRGFDISNPITDSIGVDITADGWKCQTTTFGIPDLVYDPTPIAYGTTTITGFKVLTNTLVITKSAWFTSVDYNPTAFNSVFKDGNKLVDLTTGWSAHISDTTYAAGPPEWVTMTLWGGGYYSQVVNLVDQGIFKVGDKIAVFAPSDDYICPEARIDIRDNVIHDIEDFDTKHFDGMGYGIKAYSVAVWIDGNFVFDNDEDGFYGSSLFGCGAVKVCDGGGDARDDSELLEISNNEFYRNGDGDDANDGKAEDWACDTVRPGDFDPDGKGTESGIEIVSTLPRMCIGPMITDTTSHLYIHDNDIYENTDAGIWLDTHAADAAIRILWNDITDNGVFGLSNQATCYTRDQAHTDWEEPTKVDEVDVIFRYNDITGNGGNVGDGETLGVGWGVKNWVELESYFNAKENFWNPTFDDPEEGDVMYPGGPSEGPAPCEHKYDQRSNAQGYGDAVSKGTFYNPWLSVESNLLRVLPGYQHLRAYGSDSLQLQAGWNTLAVPLPLDSGANSIEEISALGTFLMEDGVPKWEAAYQYDNEAEAWLAIDGQWDPSKDMEAVHGYFIKIDSELAPDGTKFPVIYGKMLVDLPAYDLVPGWNLIGSAFGIDRKFNTNEPDQGRWAVADPDDPGEPEARKAVSVTLESIIDWTGQSGLAMIIDPWVPGQIDKWPAPALTVQQAANLDMATGEAYWVYMKTAGALGGFEYAPLFFNADPPLPAK